MSAQIAVADYLSRPDVTLKSHPDHHTVGKEFMGHSFRAGWPAVRWFCESHDQCGYWLYATDGSDEWKNVSERAIGRSFHEIYKFEDGRMTCPGWKVPPYVLPTCPECEGNGCVECDGPKHRSGR